MIPEDKPRTIRLNNNRLFDDDLLASAVLRFLNFAVVPGRVVLQIYCITRIYRRLAHKGCWLTALFSQVPGCGRGLCDAHGEAKSTCKTCCENKVLLCENM